MSSDALSAGGVERVEWAPWLGVAISFCAGASLFAVGIVVLSRLTAYDPIVHQVVQVRWQANALAFVHHSGALLTWAVLVEGWRSSARSQRFAVPIALVSGAASLGLILFSQGVLPVVQHDEFMHSQIAWPLIVSALAMTVCASVLLPRASRAIAESSPYYLQRAAVALAVGIAIYATKGIVGIPRDAALAAEIALVILIPCYCCAAGLVSRRGDRLTVARLACAGVLVATMVLAAVPG